MILWLQPQKKRKTLKPCSHALTVGDKVRHRIGAYIGEYIGKPCPNMPEHTHKENHTNTPDHALTHKAPAHARQLCKKRITLDASQVTHTPTQTPSKPTQSPSNSTTKDRGAHPSKTKASP